MVENKNNRPEQSISNRILRLPDVMKKLGLARATVYRLQAAGDFPRSVSLGARAVGWLENEIDAWLDHRIEARDQQAGEVQS